MEDSSRTLPVFHIHVLAIDAKQDRSGQWFVLFLESNGETTWMDAPGEPVLGDQQTLYVIRKNTPEATQLRNLINKGVTREAIEEYLQTTAKKYGQWCEKTWQEAMRGATH